MRGRPEPGPAMDHAWFVWSAYGATGIAVAGLVLRAVVDATAQRRALRRLEAGHDDSSDA